MERNKSKGGAEKNRSRKRKALEAEAAKCAKLIHFFGTTTSSTVANEESEKQDSGKLTAGDAGLKSDSINV